MSIINWRPQKNQTTDDIPRTINSQDVHHSSLSDNEVKKLVKDLGGRNDTKSYKAYQALISAKPPSAVQDLAKLANKISLFGKDRRKEAIKVLGEIGTREAAEALTKISISGTDEILFLIYEQLNKIGDPVAIPFLAKKANSGRDAYERIIPMTIITNIDHPDGIPLLVSGAHKEKSMTLAAIDDDNRHANWLQSNKRGSVRMVGHFLQYKSKQKEQMRTAGILLCPILPLEMITDGTEDLQCMQTALTRATTIATLAIGEDEIYLDEAWRVAKKSFHKVSLANASAMIGVTNQHVEDALVKATKSRNLYEKLLGYDGLIKLAITTDNHMFDDIIRKGMNSRDFSVATAVSSDVLYLGYEPLISDALLRAKHKNPNTRGAMIPSISLLAELGDRQCIKALADLRNDKKKDVAEFALLFSVDVANILDTDTNIKKGS